MRPAVTLLVIALMGVLGLVALGGASPASAVPPVAVAIDEQVIARPESFGTSLIWVTRRGASSLVRERTAAGVLRTVLTIPPIDGAPAEIGTVRTLDHVGILATSRRSGDQDSSWWARPSEAFVEAPPCTLAVSGDAILAGFPSRLDRKHRCGSARVMRTTGLGVPIERSLPDIPSVVGDLYAFVDDDNTIHVRNWRTEQELYTVPGAGSTRYGLLLGEHGTVRFDDDSDEQRLEASPADPTPRPVSVRWLDGTEPFADYRPTIIYDGTRHIALRRPCARSWIRAWDRNTKAPRGPSGRCGVPRLVAPHRITIRRATIPARAMRVELRCPRSSDGCVGSLRWAVAADRDAGVEPEYLAQKSFTLYPGQTRSLTPHHSYRGHRGSPRRLTLSGALQHPRPRGSLRRSIAIHRR